MQSHGSEPPGGSSCAHAAPPGPSPAAPSRRTHGSLAQLSKAAEAFISPKSSSQHLGLHEIWSRHPAGSGAWASACGHLVATAASALSQARRREAAAPSPEQALRVRGSACTGDTILGT